MALKDMIRLATPPVFVQATIRLRGNGPAVAGGSSFWSGPSDRLCVQTVPPSIYPASYPIWISSSECFHERVLEECEIS